MQRNDGPIARRRGLRALLLCGVSLLAAGTAAAEPALRMAGVMHDNLAAVEQITEAVIREEWFSAVQGAARLRANVAPMRKLDLAALGLDPNREPEFRRYLDSQVALAEVIRVAAQGRNAPGALSGVQRLFAESCLECHAAFRQHDQERTARVLFMRGMISSVGGIYRGIAMEDFALAAREARAIGAVSQVFMWAQVTEAMFELKDPDDQAQAREYLEHISTASSRIESAAMKQDAGAVSEATRAMLEGGCISCHAKFRNADD